MKTVIKIIVIFWVVWIIWYLTGGPLRDVRSKPYIGPDKTGKLHIFGTSSLPQ